MFKIMAIVVVVFVAAVLIYAATRPDTFRVQRATSIKAPPEKIFALINHLHSWVSWSPYEKKDPTMKRTYAGAASGVGAVYEWDGNQEIGKGRMEIATTSPPSKVTLKLDFIRPFECHNIVDFTLEAQSDSTKVTWDMHGPNRFIGKVVSIFIDLDNMCGKDFEAGLANLKAQAEE